MKIELLVKQEFDIKYLVADVGPRYWEDADVNGEQDDEDNPKMPCQKGNRWVIKIDIDNGQIINWEKGITASTHYKVCDNGKYQLLNSEDKIIKEVNSYVPDILSIDDRGFGDYIEITINEDGFIEDWECNQDLIDGIIKGDFNYKD